MWIMIGFVFVIFGFIFYKNGSLVLLFSFIALISFLINLIVNHPPPFDESETMLR